MAATVNKFYKLFIFGLKGGPFAGDPVAAWNDVKDMAALVPTTGSALAMWQLTFFTIAVLLGYLVAFLIFDGPGGAFNLRGIYRTDAAGRYEIRTVRPGKYPIPHDGPVGALLKANNRGWMRPGHLHTWVKHPGYKELITHIFDRKSDHLYDDAVFGVRESLIVDFTEDDQGELSATFDFVLDPA